MEVSEANLAMDENIAVKIEDGQNVLSSTDLRSLSALLPENMNGHEGNGDTGHMTSAEIHTQFEFDEQTLRSLQQFMESQGSHPQSVENTGEQKSETTLSQGLAQHYLPTRPEAKPETEEERKARAEQVRLENRERKKKWREQNADRNKDNDLRCRVNKRANLIFGLPSSPQKTLYIENEFKKRQMKRRGKAPSPPSSDNGDMYASILNNPEFTNILMNLLQQKGLDQGDSETSAQLVELLKSNPDFLRGFLSAVPERQDAGAATGMGMASSVGMATGMGGVGDMYFPPGTSSTTYHEMEGVNMDHGLGDLGMGNGLQYEHLLGDGLSYLDPSMDSSLSLHMPIETAVDTSIETSLNPTSTSAPIPRLELRSEVEAVAAPSLPLPPAVIPTPSIPASVFIPTPMATARSRPAVERIQAFGFPPMMGQR